MHLFSVNLSMLFKNEKPKVEVIKKQCKKVAVGATVQIETQFPCSLHPLQIKQTSHLAKKNVLNNQTKKHICCTSQCLLHCPKFHYIEKENLRKQGCQGLQTKCTHKGWTKVLYPPNICHHLKAPTHAPTTNWAEPPDSTPQHTHTQTQTQSCSLMCNSWCNIAANALYFQHVFISSVNSHHSTQLKTQHLPSHPFWWSSRNRRWGVRTTVCIHALVSYSHVNPPTAMNVYCGLRYE